MTERGRRLVLWLLAAALTLPLLWKGHGTPPKTGSVAFLHHTTGKILVRLAGSEDFAGIHQFPDGSTLETVIKMALPRESLCSGHPGLLQRPLQNGEVLTVVPSPAGCVVLSLSVMAARERMALGIPLHPDHLTGQDWIELPGIGPALAAAIISDRQKYGDFGSLAGLLRVPGIGPGTLAKLKTYF